MSWSYTAYILWKYSEKVQNETVNFHDFSKFIFAELGRKWKLFLHDGDRDLYADLEYLKKIGAIDIDIEKTDEGQTIIIKIKKDNLKRIGEAVEKFVDVTSKRVGLISECRRRIDRAIEDMREQNLYR